MNAHSPTHSTKDHAPSNGAAGPIARLIGVRKTYYKPDGSVLVEAVGRGDQGLDLAIPRDNCGVYTITTTNIVRADLLLVQDKSGSMAQGINGQRNPCTPASSQWTNASFWFFTVSRAA